MKKEEKSWTLLECYGCLKVGDYSVFGLPTKCPDCGSYEIWSAPKRMELTN